MPLFYYEALTENGDQVRGTVEAISAQAARAALRQDHLEAEELHEATLEERQELTGHTPTNKPLQPFPAAADPVEAKHDILTEQKKPEQKPVKKQYYPFIDTLRLYAGWLLAWYCLVYAIGSYQYTKETYIHIPYVEALLPPYSSIVFSFTIASFIFLLLTTVHKAVGDTKMRTFGFVLLGIAVFSLYRINV